jgi:FkbM family methyltransferase
MSKRPSQFDTALLRTTAMICGAFPPGFGQHALARKILSRRSYPRGARLRQTLEHGATFDLDLSDRIQAQAFIMRRYEPEVVRLIKSRLSGGGTFFDVGANVGLITFSAGSRRPDIEIRAFEPNPLNAANWLRNRELNPTVTARLEQMAVGEHEGSAVLVQPSHDESGAGYVANGKTHQPRPAIQVPLTSLDRYVAREGIAFVDVLKLDIEGYELFALRGSSGLLSERRIGCIVCELNDVHLQRNGTTRDELIAWVRDQNYTPRPLPRVGGRRLRRTLHLPGEVVFVPTPDRD